MGRGIRGWRSLVYENSSCIFSILKVLLYTVQKNGFRSKCAAAVFLDTFSPVFRIFHILYTLLSRSMFSKKNVGLFLEESGKLQQNLSTVAH